MNAAVRPDGAIAQTAGTTPFDAAPGDATAALAAHAGPVFVDLDETLYLRNSTEDFIDLARPALLALVWLRVLEVVKPWRWTGGEATRDVWRVRLVWMLFPWTLSRWKRRVADLARQFANRPLVDALQRRRHAGHSTGRRQSTNGSNGVVEPVILTVGFRPIVAPLVAALGLGPVRVIAARLDTFADRRRGKLECALDALGEEAVSRALVITDSKDDLPLLQRCGRPLRIVWPEASYVPALSHVYLPGQYLTQVKRPGEHYIRRGILQEDFAFWVLASMGLATDPWLHVPGLLALLASFWTIYERGYVDNDQVAARHESDPKLSRAYWDAPVATPAVQPWIWAAALAVAGIVLLRWRAIPLDASIAAGCDALKWALALIACHGLFKLYNRVDKSSRVWLFAALQLARNAIFAVLVPVTPVGAMALGANALSRWVPYYVYRLSGSGWPRRADPTLIRLSYFLALGGLLGAAAGWRVLFNWTAVALLGWNLYRARQQLFALVTSARRIDRRSARTDGSAATVEAAGSGPKGGAVQQAEGVGAS